MKKLLPDMKDEELDSLFREMADNIRPAYDPEMWPKVKNALKAEDKDEQPKIAFLYKRLPGLLLLLLFVLGGVLLWEIRSPQQKGLPDRSGFRAVPLNSVGADQQTAAIPAPTKNIKQAAPTANRLASNRAALVKVKPVTEETEKPLNNDINLHNIISAGFNKRPWQSNSSFLALTQKPDDTVTKVYEQSKAVNDNLGDAASQAPIPAIHKHGLVSYKWALALSAGPDWSSVHGKGSRPGADAGLMLQYKINRRWSLESGLLVASKIYVARPSDYHASSNYYSNLISIDAHCLVYDLPINLRYDVFQREQQAIFISSGLSSFWMQHEGYTYYYKQNGSIDTYEKDIYNQNRHFLSIANIAFGYEHKWNRLSLQAAPYVKLPLSGVGYGKVKLASKGLLFSLKYGF